MGEMKRMPLSALLAALVLVGSTTDTSAERASSEKKNAVHVNGFAYTITRVSNEKSLGLVAARDDTFYLVVDFEMRNQTQRTIRHYPKFHVIDSEGSSYNLDRGAMWNVENGMVQGINLMPKRSKPVTVVFLVPTKSLSQTWTLEIRDRGDSGRIKGIKVS